METSFALQLMFIPLFQFISFNTLALSHDFFLLISHDLYDLFGLTGLKFSASVLRFPQ